LVLFDPDDRISLGWAIRASGEGAREAAQDSAERDRLELAQQQLRRMEAVAEGPGCREQALLVAVGELVPPCGRCDRCTAAPALEDWSEPAGQVLAALERRSGLDLRRLGEELAAADGGPEAGAGAAGLGLEEARWCWLARRLVQEELIRESDDGSQRLWLRPSGRRYLRQPWPLRLAA
jgi:ATP-dependent DNA helicase RecQ